MVYPSTQSASNQDLGVVLDPASIQIDGRDLRDQLAFVAQFSRLILYYNNNNQVQGDWQDFFLKDPAILLAAISKTDYGFYQAQFMQLQQKHKTVDSRWLTSLCLLIQKIFATLNLWLRNMRKHQHRFNLLVFLRDKVEHQLASQMQLFSLVYQALKLGKFQDLAGFDQAMLSLYEPEWHVAIGKSLGQEKAWREYSTDELIASLYEIFSACFDALVQVCDQAKQDFYKLIDQPCDFPDTALLRAFLKLSATQQQRLNSLSAEHLNFYYRKLLSTQPKKVLADQVYLSLRLNPAIPQWQLPEHSSFSAGNYPDQSPILFTSLYPLSLNQIAISQIYTESFVTGDAANTGPAGWYFQAQQLPEQVQYGQAGQLLDFPFWGNQQCQAFAPAIVFATPMLALAEGQRKIRLHFSFASEFDSQSLWQSARFYLSTATAWLDVSACLTQAEADGVQLDLPNTLPAITAFKQSTDGLQSQWPALKIVFAATSVQRTSPQFQNFRIEVEVSGIKQLKLLNELASLPVAEAGLMFAPPARQSARFYLGCAECFAKPLQQLTIQINWDNLPACLDAYYASYNYFLAGFPARLSPALRVFSNTAFTVNAAILKQNNWHDIAGAMSYSMGEGQSQIWVSPTLGQAAQLFSQHRRLASSDADSAESGTCKNLNQTQFQIKPDASYSGQADLLLKPLAPPAQAGAAYVSLSLNQPVPGFGSEMYPQLVAAISLQNAQILIQQAKAGILTYLWQLLKAILGKILQAFKSLWGFVSKLLAELLDWLKRLFNGSFNLQAAQSDSDDNATDTCPCISKADICDSKGLYQLPALPWQAKYTSITLDYQASYALHPVSIDEASTSLNNKAYPFEFYHCRPQGLTPLLRLTGQEQSTTSLPASLDLLPVAEFSNACYLALSHLVLPTSLSILFEISQSDDQTRQSDSKLQVYLYCQPANLELTLLRDETRGLRQSGIIVVDLPELDAAYSLRATTDQCAWLIFACDDAAVRLRLAYLAPQALRLQRLLDKTSPTELKPELAAQTIQAALPALPQLARIYQAFPSFAGRPAESADDYQDQTSYPLRVAERLLHKDRALSQSDYELLSKQGLAHVYRVIVTRPEKGHIALAPVLRYQDPTQRHAWRPRLDYDQLGQLANFISARTSAQVSVTVQNPAYQLLQIAAEIWISEQVNIALLQAQLNQALRLYLSPWIKCKQSQRQFAQALQRADLLRFIASFTGVISIESLHWRYVADDSPASLQQIFSATQSVSADILPCDEACLVVSASSHQLNLRYAGLSKQLDPHAIPLLALTQELDHV